MIELNVKKDVARLLQPLFVLSERQYPFIVARALTKTAQDVKADEIKEMDKDLDRPTPFTRGGLMVRPATKQTLQAEVDLKDWAAKGTPSHEYLQPSILGGARKPKRFEQALRASGVLPKNMFVVPSKTLKLNQYGNVAGRGLYTQILSALAANWRDPTQNRTKASGARNKRQRAFFAVNADGGKLPMGIYERKGRQINMIFAFVKQPQYKAQFHFEEAAMLSAQRNFERRLKESTDIALRTAR